MIIPIDPSINNIGYAAIDKSRVIKSGTIKSMGTEIADRLASIHTQLATELINIPYCSVEDVHYVIEIPPPFQFGRVGKGGNADAMRKLNLATGVIIALCQILACETGNVMLVESTEWKDRRSKEVDKISASHYVDHKLTDHEADAIMLGLWAETMIKRKTA